MVDVGRLDFGGEIWIFPRRSGGRLTGDGSPYLKLFFGSGVLGA